MKVYGCAYWSNLFDLYKSYESNEKFRGLSYQRDMNQYFCNVQIRFTNVEVNPLEYYLLKKWSFSVELENSSPYQSFTFPDTGYADIEDSFKKIKDIASLITEHNGEPSEIDKMYQLPLYTIKYLVNVTFTKSSILNIIGSFPLQNLPEKLKKNLDLFKSMDLDVEAGISNFLVELFTKNFHHYVEVYFQDPDIFTEAQVFQRYLKHAKPTYGEFTVILSHVIYDCGTIHFINSNKETLSEELKKYKTYYERGLVNADHNKYSFAVCSSLKVFFGFYIYTNWVSANENFFIPLGENKHLFSEFFLPENVYHQNMVNSLFEESKFLLQKKNHKDNEESLLATDSQPTIDYLPIASMLPGTAEFRFMLQIRGDENLYHYDDPGTKTKQLTNAVLQKGYMQAEDFQKLAKLVSGVKNSIRTIVLNQD